MVDQEKDMITLEKWNVRIDAFIREENNNAGREIPVHRIYCQDDTDRSGGGLYNETVTADTIGRFARAIGDSNPLYTNPAYVKSNYTDVRSNGTCQTAAESGTPVEKASAAAGGTSAEKTTAAEGAPPAEKTSAILCFPAPPLLECCICSTFIGGKLPRLRGLDVYDAGTKWERFAPILSGDSFSATITYLGIEEITKPGKADRLLLRKHEINLKNQHGEHVSRLTARSIIRCRAPIMEETSDSVISAEPGNHDNHLEAALSENHEKYTEAAGSENHDRDFKAAGLKNHEKYLEAGRTEKQKDHIKTAESCINGRPRYTQEQLEKVYANLDAQFEGILRRGNRPRYWEEVKIGEDLPEEIAGPYDESDGQSLMAAIGVSNAFATKWGTIRRGRGTPVIDPETGARRLPIDRHISDAIARAQGLPRALVSGIHSQALLAKCVSDWMGDAGFLQSLDCRCRRPLYYGDLSFQRGRVTDKYEKDGMFFAVLRMEAVRQDGIVHSEAEAVVRLPARI